MYATSAQERRPRMICRASNFPERRIHRAKRAIKVARNGNTFPFFSAGDPGLFSMDSKGVLFGFISGNSQSLPGCSSY
jgi:precorrin-3B methylase